MVSNANLQNSISGYRNSRRHRSFKQFYAVRVLKEFRSVHDLSITELAEYLRLSRSTTQRLCQYGANLKYNPSTWEKVYEFVENLPPVQKKLF